MRTLAENNDYSWDSAETEKKSHEYKCTLSMECRLDDYVWPTALDPSPLYERCTSYERCGVPDIADISCQGDRHVAAGSDSDEAVDEEILQVQCWVPGKGLDAMVLSVYMEYFVDCTAVIGQSRSPDDDSKTGFAINAQAAMGIGELRDILEDSESWNEEMTGREYRKSPYSYLESDTWLRRWKAGPTIDHKCPAPRQRKTAAVSEPLVPARPTIPSYDCYQVYRYTYF